MRHVMAIAGLCLPLWAWAQAPGGALAGTAWQLVQIHPASKRSGAVTLDAASGYTLHFNADGRLLMRLNCNQGSGRWQAQPQPDGRSGRLTLEPAIMTTAACAAPELYRRVDQGLLAVRAFNLRDGRLHLSLTGDDSLFVWDPLPRR